MSELLNAETLRVGSSGATQDERLSREDAIAALAAATNNREIEGGNPFAEMDFVRRGRLGAARLPDSDGNPGCSTRELMKLVIDLAEADADVAHALRVHFAFVEGLLLMDEDGKNKWVPIIESGAIMGNAITEIGPNANQAGEFIFNTTIRETDDGWRLEGKKYFSTGSLFSDYIWIYASDEEGSAVYAIIPADRDGVTLIDD